MDWGINNIQSLYGRSHNMIIMYENFSWEVRKNYITVMKIFLHTVLDSIITFQIYTFLLPWKIMSFLCFFIIFLKILAFLWSDFGLRVFWRVITYNFHISVVVFVNWVSLFGIFIVIGWETCVTWLIWEIFTLIQWVLEAWC